VPPAILLGVVADDRAARISTSRSMIAFRILVCRPTRTFGIRIDRSIVQ
jgi:hypothetical protein